MTRSTFGATSADFLISVGPARQLRAQPGTITLWSAQSGGTQYTDLLLDGVAVSAIPVDSSGQVPQFQGPDGVVEIWADAGGSRVRLVTVFTDVAEATDAGIAALLGDADSSTTAALNAKYVAGRACSTDGTDSLPTPTGVGLEFVITAGGLDDIRYDGTSL